MKNVVCAEKKNFMKNRLYELFEQSIATKRATVQGGHLDILIPIAQKIADSIKTGGKLMLCGNGGSAADAQHLAAELLIRLRSSVNRSSIGAITLATDISSITACGNDYSFDDIFSRPLEGLGRPGDVLLGITTSGKSPNVIKAFAKAKDMGVTTVGFLGGAMGGKPALDMCDMAFVVPSHDTARVQEVHITAGHALMEMIEDTLMSDGFAKQI